MKRLLFLLLIIGASIPVFSQTYGNEWINFNQKYYSFNVYSTGVHRINQTTIAAAGIPIATFSSANIQLFGKEKEVPILVVDGNDNSFDSGDYILFYAEKNDGWIDSLIYPDPTYIANPGYSLYNDTIQYFFTWNNSLSNLRFAEDLSTDYSGHTPIDYVIKELHSSESAEYSEGKQEGLASGSIFAPGEGWGFTPLESVTGLTYNLPIPTANLYMGPAEQPHIHFSYGGRSDAEFSGTGNHHSRFSIGSTILHDEVFTAFKNIKVDYTFPQSELQNTTSFLKIEILNDVGAILDNQILTYYSLTYPRLPHAENLPYDNFTVPNNQTDYTSLINLQGLTASVPVAFYFGANTRSLTCSFNSGAWQLLVPDNISGDGSRVIIGDAANAINVSTLEPVNGTGAFMDFSTLSTEEALLMIYHPALQSATANYAAYRSSLTGGSYNVVLANINELYQQYGGGVEKHVIAIRRFALHAYNMAAQKPLGLFLVGKGISERLGSRKSAANFANSYIPSFGYPASDLAITAGLNGTQWDPLIPTGRISARTITDLQNYLDKVMEYEAAQNQNDIYSSATKDWQKQVLHFAGGSNIEQQTAFQNNLKGMENIIEDSLFAGNVFSYNKTSSDPLDPTVIAGITDKISNGVSLMNFFGHGVSGTQGFEINVDDPSNWENAGKYPVVIGNSCYNGDIYRPDIVASEHYVNLPSEGSIAFIASVSTGYDAYLSLYTTQLYKHFSQLSYGERLGEQMRRNIQDVQSDPANLILETTCMQMVLHGDPMLRLNWHAKPEIEITAQSIYFEPKHIDLTVDSIDMNIILTNLGKAVVDSFYIEVKRDFPGTTIDSTYLIFVPRLNYKDTIRFRFPTQPTIAVGQNYFTIAVDIPSAIAEQYDEIANNSTTASLLLNVDGILPVYPYDFAVVPRDSVAVKASTINPIVGIRTYYFELDTTPYYHSPELRRYTITAPGGVKEVKPDQWKNAAGNPFPLVCTDSTVYFWRVAIDSSVISWNEFTFQYIKDKVGWAEDHFFQGRKNDFYSLTYDTLNRVRSFGTAEVHQVKIDAYDAITYSNAWYLDNAQRDYGSLPGAPLAIYVFVLDPITLKPWGTRFGSKNSDHGFGNANDNPDSTDQTICPGCRNRPEYFFGFLQTDAAQLAAFQNMIDNEIPNGHYVGIYTIDQTKYSSWDALYPPVYTTFQHTIGSTLVNNSQPEKPFAMFFRKGDHASLVEKHYPDTITDGSGTKVQIIANLTKSAYIGFEKTPLIGPALNWNTIFWKRDSLELFASDSARLYIEAYNINQELQVTIDTLFTPNDSIINLNTLLPAVQYPYLRLGVYNTDDQFFTPAQIDRLHVLYDPVPEAAIDGTTAYYINPLSDSLSEGETVSFAVDVKNISDFPMDSLLVNYWVEDANRIRHYLPYERKDSLLPGEVLRDTIRFSTLGYPGSNVLWMEVNPYVNGSIYVTDQPEQYHFNNLLQLPFRVAGDDEQPLLDVTFSGKHILNGDIIDPESEILITLRDDNPYLIMDNVSDTSLFGIYLTDPSGIQKRIPFIDGNGNTVMQWIPADAQNKKFKIVYPHMFEKNGVYSLFVQGTDRSGNLSGDIEYKISFEVVRESSITFMMNYPNPFSTSTRFVFTLTGTEEPDDMIIQIMTVTGRVVREITEAEIGRITIGRNISEYAWDGTDEFGDPLANGVYLYRVKAKINGEDIKHRDSGADNHFKKEFGKMYLMR